MLSIRSLCEPPGGTLHLRRVEQIGGEAARTEVAGMHGREGSAMEQQGCCWCSAVHSGENPPHPHYFVFFILKDAGELCFIILRMRKEGKRSMRVQEKTQHIPTHVNTLSLAHTQNTHKRFQRDRRAYKMKEKTTTQSFFLFDTGWGC
jgi:hypothetical protein